MSRPTYGDVSGYAKPDTSENALTKYRTGKHACNPAEAQALVRVIDKLRDSLAASIDAEIRMIRRNL